MDKNHVLSIVTKLIRREAPEITAPIPPAASFEALGVDSMTVMDIVTTVENELGIQIPDDELALLSTVEVLVDLALAELPAERPSTT
ncbi:acyl carrier protein [Actinomadura formosensis]|uniref:acyl carrier protein n=1 Tax=Actinomadura formosensis TaxID=60706 RepID=UPI00082F9283|nr:acyl carrier protein [Actinomadura formosensis]